MAFESDPAGCWDYLTGGRIGLIHSSAGITPLSGRNGSHQFKEMRPGFGRILGRCRPGFFQDFLFFKEGFSRDLPGGFTGFVAVIWRRWDYLLDILLDFSGFLFEKF